MVPMVVTPWLNLPPPEREHVVQEPGQAHQVRQLGPARRPSPRDPRPRLLLDALVLPQGAARDREDLADQVRRLLPLRLRPARLLDRLLHLEAGIQGTISLPQPAILSGKF